MSLTDLTSTSDYRSTRGRCPIFRPMINGIEFEITPQSATIVMGDSDHDSVTLSATSSVLTTTEGMVDSTISFYWGQAPRTELFCGYIVGVTVDQSGQGSMSFTLAILGVSKEMQQGTPRFWTNKTTPSIVQTLAYANGMGFTSHPHTHLWHAISQTSESDWATAVGTARRLGWSLFNRYGILMCYDPAVLFEDSGSYCTLISSQDQDFKPVADRRLIEFTPEEQSGEDPTNMGTKVAYFGDNGQITVAMAKGTFTKYRFATNWVISSNEDADIYVNSARSRIDQWKQYARARIWGDADIYPGMCLDVVTSNSAYYSSKYDGRWLVRATQQQMDTQQYQTNLVLSRPSNKAPVSQGSYSPFWISLGKTRPNLSLQDNKWTSSWADSRVRTIL